MITRVHIRRYKSLADVEVRLQPLSVLFGPNAAGKSNFLDALQLLSAMVATGRPLIDAFRPPYRGQPLESFAFADGGVAGLLERESATFEIEVDLHLSDSTVEAVNRQVADWKPEGNGGAAGSKRADVLAVRERRLRYRVEIEVMPKRGGLIRVKDEQLTALTDVGELSTRRKAFISAEDGHLVLRSEGGGRPTQHELGLDHTLLSRPLYAPHYPHAIAAQRELASWSFFYFEPRERMRLPNPIKEVRQIGNMGEELAAYLNTLRAENPVRFDSIERSLQTLIPSIERIQVVQSPRGEVELYLVEAGVPIPARVVSEGTLRVLGLLSIATGTESAPLVGFEEPENGIHPRRIALVASLLRSVAGSAQIQLIVTTHSPHLIDELPEGSLFQVHKSAGVTRIQPVADMSRFIPLLRSRFTDSGLDDGGEAFETIGDRIAREDVGA